MTTARCPRCGESLILVIPAGDVPLPKASWTIAEVSAATGVGITSLQSKSRMRDIVRARWAAMWLLRAQGLSTPHIGRLFNRDHSTVMHALDAMRRDDALRAWAESMTQPKPEAAE